MPRPRFQFRLSTLLWITLAVACWFGGMGFEGWRPVNQILIVGPPSRKGFTPPSPNEIASALEGAGRVNRLPKNFRLILDPVADYDDPPDSSGSQLHHSRYKCQIVGDEGTRTICVPPSDVASPDAVADR